MMKKLIPTSRVARVAISLAVLASLVAISIIVAGATSGTPEDAADLVAQAHAEMHGVTVEQATEHLALQKTAGLLEEQLVLYESDTFAGIWIQHGPEFTVVAKFTSDDGESIIRPHIEGGDLNGLVRVGTAANTMAALQQAQAAAKTTGESVDTETESDINVFENRVELYVLDKSGFEDNLTERGTTLPAAVLVLQVPKFSTKETNVYGGLNVTGSASPYPCTSGFSVTDNAGTDGITTAHHCGDAYFRYNGDDFNVEGGGDGGAIDLMWASSPDYTPVNRIKVSNSGAVTTITGTVHRNNQIIGSTICKYGRSTHHTCGTLISKTLNTTWMRVRNLGITLSDHGDSGGPWYVNHDAYGTHGGSVDVLGADNKPTGDVDAYYMAVNFFSHLGIEVLTD